MSDFYSFQSQYQPLPGYDSEDFNQARFSGKSDQDIYNELMYQGYSPNLPPNDPKYIAPSVWNSLGSYSYTGSQPIPTSTNSSVNSSNLNKAPVAATPTTPATTSTPVAAPTPTTSAFDARNFEFNKGRDEVFGKYAYNKALEAGYTPEEIKASIESQGLQYGARLNAEMGNPNEWDEARMEKAAAAAAKWEGMSKEEKRAAMQERRTTRQERRANRPESASLGEMMTNV